jgi:hypothetical protein
MATPWRKLQQATVGVATGEDVATSGGESCDL